MSITWAPCISLAGSRDLKPRTIPPLRDCQNAPQNRSDLKVVIQKKKGILNKGFHKEVFCETWSLETWSLKKVSQKLFHIQPQNPHMTTANHTSHTVMARKIKLTWVIHSYGIWHRLGNQLPALQWRMTVIGWCYLSSSNLSLCVHPLHGACWKVRQDDGERMGQIPTMRKTQQIQQKNTLCALLIHWGLSRLCGPDAPAWCSGSPCSGLNFALKPNGKQSTECSGGASGPHNWADPESHVFDKYTIPEYRNAVQHQTNGIVGDPCPFNEQHLNYGSPCIKFICRVL